MGKQADGETAHRKTLNLNLLSPEALNPKPSVERLKPKTDLAAP